MGFFTDLKEDLSQAVGELMPEDEILESLPDELLTDEPLLEEEEAGAEAGAEAEAQSGEFEDVAAELFETFEDELSEDGAEDAVFEEEAKEADFAEETEAPGSEVTFDLDEMLDKLDDGTETNIMKEDDEMNDESIYVATAEAENMKTDFSGKKVSDETATITAGMSIVGNITSEGSLELEGNVTGNIDILGKLNMTGNVIGDSKASEIFADNAKITGEIKSLGSVKIGQSTVIIGNIFANSAVIAGAVKGDIDVMGPVILDTSAIVMGNIKSKSVQINNGAVIEGMCSQCYAEVNPTSFFDEMKKGKKG
ncbi:MAG: polymer-forming cytoskeletal protein [Lachnospiraceae bacterium]|nr:polymer-forming cytoskeletal protein [Lachnospiraceae bacterium]